MSDAKIIRKYLKSLESSATILAELRATAKTEGGRMTVFGGSILSAGEDCGVKQAFMAQLLDISPGAVSQHYKKNR